jgi:hypothetical protein
MLKFIEIGGTQYAWKEILRMCCEQSKADRRPQQLTLFELRDDSRPASQQSVRRRYEEPMLFDVD